ncbi:TonB-dependent receptor [Ochrobactrum sp. BTU2]|uniref:TonB-dependent receptor n=1 Tax=Ochrobactrum sp. BTU2 TaxID=2856166 RepID=UPI00211A0D89|nr:TonB-dependent receptor [Ochrobactrum sp. BTU2]
MTASVYLLGLSGTASLAQDAGGETVLKTITVTAAKREQEIGKVDASLTAVTGADLAERGIRTVEDLQKVFPGVSMGNRGNRIYSNVTVRGISSPDHFNPTVQVYVDGVPQLPSTFSQMLTDVERVELLRGPQGTLYGANAYGGVINIITKKKDANRFYIETNVSLDEPSVEIGGTAVVIPETLYFDYAGSFRHFSGDADDATTGKNNINTSNNGYGRAALRYEPTGGDFDATVSFAKEKLLSHEELYFLSPDVDDRIYRSGILGALPELRRDVTTLSGQWNYRFGDFTLSSVTGYQKSEVTRDFSGGYGWPHDDETISQELRLSYMGDQFSGVAGLWYSHNDFMGRKSAIAPYYGVSTNNVVTNSAAAFGELIWHATDRLDLTGGLRATYDHSSIDAFRADTYATGMGFDFERDADFTSLQPKFTAGYQVTPDMRVFGVVSRGYKSGGFNHSISSTIDDAPYDPESNWNFEAGVKSTLFDGNLDLSASVYHIRSTDKQIYVGIIGQQFIINAGKASSTGIELEAAWRATEKLTLTGNAAFGRSKFTDFVDPYTGVSYNGNRIPYAPDVTAHLNVAYVLSDDLFDGTLTANTAANIYSKTWFDEANAAGQSGFATFDASLNFAKSDGLSAKLYVQNITDKSYKTSGYMRGTSERGTLGKGRTFGLILRKEF